MRKESKYPGYFVVIDGDDVYLEHRGKRMTNQLRGNQIYWGVMTEKGKCLVPAEKVILETFPGIDRKIYLFQLYDGVENTVCNRTRSVEITPGVVLTLLYGKTAYMLETPLETDISEIRKMFPGTQIYVTEGNETRKWQELYFTSGECMLLVTERLKLFFIKNLTN